MSKNQIGKVLKKMKVFLCEHIHKKAYDYLQSFAEIIPDLDRRDEVDAAINRNIKMNAAWMDACPNLKVIGIHGTGTDDVDLLAAKQRGIQVVNVPYENAESVAELIILLALTMARRIPEIQKKIYRGEEIPNGGGSMQGRELTGKTFGMIGCGDIAMRAARKLKFGFNMHLVGFSRSLTEEKAAEIGVEYCSSMEEVFEKSDIVNIGVPLTDSTRNMVTMEQMKHAKEGCILINTARGPVVNEEDLYDALSHNILAAAACDVFHREPPLRQDPLMTLPNFMGTPHIGANTDEALERVGMSVVNKIRNILIEE